jgi:hypothetical protein
MTLLVASDRVDDFLMKAERDPGVVTARLDSVLRPPNKSWGRHNETMQPFSTDAKRTGLVSFSLRRVAFGSETRCFAFSNETHFR